MNALTPVPDDILATELASMELETARGILVEQLAQAHAEESAASDRCDAVGLAPYPDGFQRLQKASEKYIVAHQKVLIATRRLTTLGRHGTIPKDLRDGTGST
jgi:hypothetical protein